MPESTSVTNVVGETLKRAYDVGSPEIVIATAKFRVVWEDGNYTSIEESCPALGLSAKCAAIKAWSNILERFPDLAAQCRDVEPNLDLMSVVDGF